MPRWAKATVERANAKACGVAAWEEFFAREHLDEPHVGVSGISWRKFLRTLTRCGCVDLSQFLDYLIFLPVRIQCRTSIPDDREFFNLWNRP